MTGDPEEVPSLIETHRPDLVLLDLLLPGTDGIELMQSLHALADLPVIFLSGYGRDETIARALEIGAADYVVKPFSPTELVARIEAVLRKRAGRSEPFRAGEARHRLHGASREPGRPAGTADRHGVRSPHRPFRQRRPRLDLRLSAAPRVAVAARTGPPDRTRLP